MVVGGSGGAVFFPTTHQDVITITTIYFINPSGKLKLSFDRTTKNIIVLNHEPHAHTHT